MINFEDYTNLSKFEKNFLSELITDLEKNENSMWNKSWNYTNPKNAFTDKNYSGLNSLFLSFISEIKGYDDPRFSTFNQAKKNGYYIEKGSKGIPIQFFSFINKETKKAWDDNEFLEKTKNMSTEEKNKELKKKVALLKTFTVFNAKNIINIDNNLSLSDDKPISKSKAVINPDRIEQFENNLKNNMNIAVEEKYTDKAFYSPKKDKVTIPLKEQFDFFEERMSVLLHELGHATGHESRLNRDLSGTFGDKNYAIEELRAEINSVFMSNLLMLNISDNQKQNHLIYLSSWINSIKDDPKSFLNALNDSLKIKEYMLEKGHFNEIFLDTDKKNTLTENDYKKLIEFDLSHYEKIEILNSKILYTSDLKQSPTTSEFDTYKDLWEEKFKEQFAEDFNNFTLDEIKNNEHLIVIPDLFQKIASAYPEIKLEIEKAKEFEKSIKEVDLDNDGISDRIDIDDTRNSVQTVSDLSEVSNLTSKEIHRSISK